MTDIHDRGRALAIRMLAPRSKGGKGLNLTLTKPGQKAYDPATSTVTTSPQAFTGSGLRESYKQTDIDGTLIRQGDVKLLVSPVQADGTDLPEPVTGDQIRFDGKVLKVISVEPWNYAGVACGYEVQGRA
ncbi:MULTISPECIES: hypothetical protein [unclassified Pseudomonas]|uniref:hypothetical protein n=1 Tax=unclassified Pseudomonas TaxID=196821 RepID=UPI002361F0B1|nr:MULTISPECIES: hypothetical protein [unclassified Pseudomonas]